MGKDLSNDQVSAMKEAFTLFDTDGDGKIAPSELGILMRSLGGNPTQAQLKSIIAEEKLTSPFDFNRFTDLMGKHLKPEPFDRQLRDAFKVIDKEGTGHVVVADLKHILTSIGEKLEPAEISLHGWLRNDLLEVLMGCRPGSHFLFSVSLVAIFLWYFFHSGFGVFCLLVFDKLYFGFAQGTRRLLALFFFSFQNGCL
ncbi:hypothetical protein L1987_11721 [Smallanthus sonchifolius]|uniref:Uncharacterized protein n=1 Tax=Smallanthus sonchifolius TaxID=185202 RepID=A0ACB9JE05_9ASTR|nr:hypothetical protein L1987_11721 [Smallanthus sonchifolius]